MKKQVTVMVEVAITMEIDVQEGQDIQSAVDEVIQECDYNFTANEESNANIVDTEIIDVGDAVSTNIS